MKKIIILLTVFTASFTAVGCDSYLDIEPEGKIIPKTVEDYRKVITTAYSIYPQHKSLTSLRTDEVVLDEESIDFSSYREIAMWKDTNLDQSTTPFQWQAFYEVIFYTNQIINEGQSTMEASSDKDQLLAEAYVLRAYAYFDLINLYGKPYNSSTSNSDKGVPLNLSLDLEKTLSPSTVEQVYFQIHKDLEKSASLMVLNQQVLGVNYRFSKIALASLNARIDLYQQNWNSALNNANLALNINNNLVDLNSNKIIPNRYDSDESIMVLDFNFISALQSSTIASDELINSYDKANDLRFAIYFENNGDKYKILKGGSSDFKSTFRTSELYFIKAEALLKLNHLEEAKSALSILLKNRYTTEGYNLVTASISSMNIEQFMSFILEEKNREFCLEGQRWFDLRRANQKEIKHKLNGVDYILQKNDVRYTIEVPTAAKLNNPNL